MSWRFLDDAVRYLYRASRCTPEALRRLTGEERQRHLRSLPLDAVFEPLRGPLQHVRTARDVFAIPEDNLFFVDLLGEEVITAQELRARYYGLLTRPAASPTDRVLVWMVLDVYTHACRALLHLSRSGSQPRGYSVHALFVSQEELQQQCSNSSAEEVTTTRHVPLQEALLLALAAFADTRGVELRLESGVPVLPVATFMCSVLGFMSDERRLLVRPPMQDLIQSQQLLTAVCRQVARTMRTQSAALGGGRTGDCSQSTAAAMPPSAPSRS